MSKADRLLLILNLIRARGNLKVRDLAKECEVSERTIYRDVVSISSANIPIYFENGYKFLTEAFLPPLNFSKDEYLAIYLGLNSDIIYSNPALKSFGKSALAKIESLLPEKLKHDYLKIKKSVENEYKPRQENSKQFLIFSLLQVLLEETKVQLQLTSSKSTRRIKNILPEKLLYKDGEWFLIAIIKGKKKKIPLSQVKSITF